MVLCVCMGLGPKACVLTVWASIRDPASSGGQCLLEHWHQNARHLLEVLHYVHFHFFGWKWAKQWFRPKVTIFAMNSSFAWGLPVPGDWDTWLNRPLRTYSPVWNMAVLQWQWKSVAGADCLACCDVLETLLWHDECNVVIINCTCTPCNV